MRRIFVIFAISLFFFSTFSIDSNGESFQLTELDKNLIDYLSDISWEPDGDYALIVGYEGVIYECTGNKLKKISTDIDVDLNGVDWKPDGSSALIVGDRETVLEYDGSSVSTINSKGSTYSPYHAVRWNPQGSEALLVGGSANHGRVDKYDGNDISPITIWGTRGINDLRWSPDGTYCLMVGAHGSVYKYTGLDDYETLTTEEYSSLFELAWKPGGSYALIVGLNGTLIKYNGASFELIQIDTNENLMTVEWKPDGSYALIGGEEGTIFKYDGNKFEDIFSEWETNNLNSIEWHPTSDYALIAGSGLVKKYSEGSTETISESGFELFGGMGLLIIILIVVIVVVIAIIYFAMSKKKKDMPPQGPIQQGPPMQYQSQYPSQYQGTQTQQPPPPGYQTSTSQPPSQIPQKIDMCPNCYNKPRFIEQEQRWYCSNCHKYL
jgi:WD40 repeat protein